jgi:uncharacterized protein (DUF697 family)
MNQDEAAVNAESVTPSGDASDTPLKTTALLADDIIKNHVMVAMAAGSIPFPLIGDMVAVAGIEVHMITKLARAYSFPVPERLVLYKLPISVVGGIGPAYLSVKFGSVIKSLPLAGHVLFLGSLSIAGGASVYAVCKIFQEHFESGGTLLSSDNATLKRYFKEKYREGKQLIPAMASSGARN